MPYHFQSNSNVCTVQTVTDLQNALKCDDDIQIVVPNELLETSEFKAFISNFNSFPIHDRPNQHHHDSSTLVSLKESPFGNVDSNVVAHTPKEKQNMDGEIPGTLMVKSSVIFV